MTLLKMQKERLDRVNSKHRDQSPADTLKYFQEMCSGSKEGAKWCLRDAKRTIVVPLKQGECKP